MMRKRKTTNIILFKESHILILFQHDVNNLLRTGKTTYTRFQDKF